MVCLLLIVMGLGTFAPCILLPEWRKFQTLEAAALIEEHRTAALQTEVEQQRRLLAAICSDPAVVARLAQRELGYERPHAEAITVAAPVVVTGPQQPFVPVLPEPPPAIARVANLLPNFDYDRIFCDREVRPVIMAMSIGLIVVAMALFSPRAQPKPA